MAAIIIIVLVLGLMGVGFWIEQLLWNNVLTEVFVSIPDVTYWQMVGLSILAYMLFGTKTYNNKSRD
jgi:hypothetical protein